MTCAAHWFRLWDKNLVPSRSSGRSWYTSQERKKTVYAVRDFEKETKIDAENMGSGYKHRPEYNVYKLLFS